MKLYNDKPIESKDDKLIRELLYEVKRDEIQKDAQKFFDLHFKIIDKICGLCGAENCQYNKSCIKCNNPFND